MELVEPTMQYEGSFLSSLVEENLPDEQGFGMIGQNYKDLGSPETLEEYIQIRKDHAEGKNLKEGWVPATTYWLIDRDIFIGEITVRHELTDHLRNAGGHIGYWIRTSERQKGFGKIILKLALKKAKELGIKEVLVTCDETNTASKRIIEANGGVFERSQEMGEGNPDKLLYWI